MTDLERPVQDQPVQDQPRGIPSDNLPPSFAPTVNRKGQRPSIKSVVLPNVAANAAGAAAGIAAGNNAQPRIPTILPTPHHSTRQAASVAAAQPTIPTAQNVSITTISAHDSRARRNNYYEASIGRYRHRSLHSRFFAARK